MANRLSVGFFLLYGKIILWKWENHVHSVGNNVYFIGFLRIKGAIWETEDISPESRNTGRGGYTYC